MYPHRIRLGGPWTIEAPGVAGTPTIALPCRWTEAGVPTDALIHLLRRFSWLARLETHERLWLAFDRVPGVVEALLNEQPLSCAGGFGPEFEQEVTPLIQQRNLLHVALRPAEAGTERWGEVALEVRASAFLRGVSVWHEETTEGIRWHARGEVAGHADRPLDLYVLCGGTSVLDGRVDAGQAFHLHGDPRPNSRAGGLAPVQVELVNGAVVWWRVEALSSPAALPD